MERTLHNPELSQIISLSLSEWNAIIDRFEELEDALVTLQAELDIATGQIQVETIIDADAFIREIIE